MIRKNKNDVLDDKAVDTNINNQKNQADAVKFLSRGTMFSHTCQWPINEPGTAKFKFCCKPVFNKRPYCLKHCEIAYRKKSYDKKYTPSPIKTQESQKDQTD